MSTNANSKTSLQEKREKYQQEQDMMENLKRNFPIHYRTEMLRMEGFKYYPTEDELNKAVYVHDDNGGYNKFSCSYDKVSDFYQKTCYKMIDGVSTYVVEYFSANICTRRMVKLYASKMSDKEKIDLYKQISEDSDEVGEVIPDIDMVYGGGGNVEWLYDGIFKLPYPQILVELREKYHVFW